MKYQIIILLASTFFLTNCSSNNQKSGNALDTVDQINPVDTIFTGGGNEPGWQIILMKNAQDSLLYNLILDYGERHFIGSAFNNSKDLSRFELTNSSKKLTLIVNEAKCIDDADSQFTHKILLTDSKFQYLGCGTFN
ncbi:MAG: putative membrane protein [Bacteroidia bacterium]|jgi:uncharacterized membrane protein